MMARLGGLDGGPPPQAMRPQLPPPPQLKSPDQGGPVTIDDVVELLRDDKMRSFRIDVETDSLIEADQIAEKQQRTEFVRAVGQFIGQFGPVMQTMPAFAPLASALLKFAVKGFKVGQELEDVIDQTMDQAAQQGAQGQQQAASAGAVKAQAEQLRLEGTKAKTQAEVVKAQLGVQQAQIAAQADAQKHAATMQASQAEHDMETMHKAILHRQEMERHAADMAQAEQDAAIERAANQTQESK